jgi:hypothetical protein
VNAIMQELDTNFGRAQNWILLIFKIEVAKLEESGAVMQM